MSGNVNIKTTIQVDVWTTVNFAVVPRIDLPCNNRRGEVEKVTKNRAPHLAGRFIGSKLRNRGRRAG